MDLGRLFTAMGACPRSDLRDPKAAAKNYMNWAVVCEREGDVGRLQELMESYYGIQAITNDELTRKVVGMDPVALVPEVICSQQSTPQQEICRGLQFADDVYGNDDPETLSAVMCAALEGLGYSKYWENQPAPDDDEPARYDWPLQSVVRRDVVEKIANMTGVLVMQNAIENGGISHDRYNVSLMEEAFENVLGYLDAFKEFQDCEEVKRLARILPIEEMYAVVEDDLYDLDLDGDTRFYDTWRELKEHSAPSKGYAVLDTPDFETAEVFDELEF